jgi:hypothetical protein
VIRQLIDSPPKEIVYKSLEVLARITVPVAGENGKGYIASPKLVSSVRSHEISGKSAEESLLLTEQSIDYALDILDPHGKKMKSRNREVFATLILLHSYNEDLMIELSGILTFMCKLQPPEFVIVSFAVEIDKYIQERHIRKLHAKQSASPTESRSLARDLKFASSFVQNLNHVLLHSDEARDLRKRLKDCVGSQDLNDEAKRRIRLFHILLHSFAHNFVATVSLCLWSGAYRTASLILCQIDPLDINLMLFVELDRLVEFFERPLFR